VHHLSAASAANRIRSFSDSPILDNRLHSLPTDETSLSTYLQQMVKRTEQKKQKQKREIIRAAGTSPDKSVAKMTTAWRSAIFIPYILSQQPIPFFSGAAISKDALRR
jgi:hypothetical protein